LTIIKSYLGVVDEKLARQEPVSGELTILNEEIDRVGNIIKEFAGVTVPPPSTAVNLNRVTSDIVGCFGKAGFCPHRCRLPHASVIRAVNQRQRGHSQANSGQPDQERG
jgi:hypothetical protein